MGLFGRRSPDKAAPSGLPPGPAGPPAPSGQAASRLDIPGLAAYAAAHGWQAAGGHPLESNDQEFVHDAARSMYGVSRGVATYRIKVTQTSYRDCYRGTSNGHEFLVANGWTSIVELHAVSVCRIRLGWFLGEPVWIEPARYAPIVAAHQIETGDRAFDRQFRVRAGRPQTVGELLADSVRGLMMARDDWCFSFGGAMLLCVGRAGYRSAADVEQRLAELVGLTQALPPPSTVHAAAQPITLSGGVVYDPARIEEWKAALSAVPPDRQQQLLDELRAVLAERRRQRPAR
jgi:hypothetical protein